MFPLLDRLGGNANVEGLTALLINAPPPVREFAADRLGYLAAEGVDVRPVVPVLRLAATDDDDAKVRRAADAAVRRIDRPRGRP
jgi:hypothetical protein